MAKFTVILFKFTFLLLSIVVILGSIAIFRALSVSEESVAESCLSLDEDYISENRSLSKRLSQAIQFKTINYDRGSYDKVEIQKFLTFIHKSFPLVHSSPIVKREIVNNLSLLYHVKGSDPALKPYMLAGHMDVVPVDESRWEDPPFKGIIRNGYIWGRGTIDCKHIVMGVLEALEFLLEKKYQPVRSFYLAFGHDEEGGGEDGARHIRNLLKSRNVKLEYILDEGSFVLDNFIPGIKSPVAFVAVSEKGSLNLELKVDSVPGHSSFPSKETAIVILAKAISKLEGDVFPSMFGKGPEAKLFEELAYCAPLPLKIIFRNIWLFKYLLIAYMSNPIMSATHRTTTAVTIVSGGNKVNVLPSSASANINLRVHPAQTIDEAVEYVKYIVNDDRVKIRIISQVPPHPVSPMDTFGYFKIKKSIKQIYNESCVVPVTLIANTDTKWYLELSESIYRFSLIRMLPNETVRFHGDNERIEISSYVKLVNFYLHLIKNSDAAHIELKHSHTEL